MDYLKKKLFVIIFFLLIAPLAKPQIYGKVSVLPLSNFDNTVLSTTVGVEYKRGVNGFEYTLNNFYYNEYHGEYFFNRHQLLYKYYIIESSDSLRREQLYISSFIMYKSMFVDGFKHVPPRISDETPYTAKATGAGVGFLIGGMRDFRKRKGGIEPGFYAYYFSNLRNEGVDTDWNQSGWHYGIRFYWYIKI